MCKVCVQDWQGRGLLCVLYLQKVILCVLVGTYVRFRVPLVVLFKCLYVQICEEENILIKACVASVPSFSAKSAMLVLCEEDP